MKTQRHRPVSIVQAIAGTVIGALAIALLVALSHALLLPRLTAVSLPPAQEEGEDALAPGEVVCDPPEFQFEEPISVTSAELIECPQLYDDRVVSYTGEAVGPVLLRPTQGWVHLNDDPYANQLGPLSRHRTVAGGNSGMAISMPREDAAEVTAGNRNTHGTLVEVIGRYHRAYEGDGGAPAIEAMQVAVVREAERFSHEVSVRRVVAASLSGAIALVLLVVRQLRRRR